MATASATCVLEIRSDLGEGPVWQAGEKRLYWLDLAKPGIYRFDPASGRNEQLRADIGTYVGGLVFRQRGGWIVVREDGISAVDPVSGRRQVLLHPEADLPGNWFNDCKCDRLGRLWTGSADRKEKDPTGNLYVIDAKLGVRRVDSGIICANGPAFSPDGRTAYFADSFARKIFRYDIDPATGEVGPRSTFVTVPDEAGVPDGMTVDAEGFLVERPVGRLARDPLCARRPRRPRHPAARYRGRPRRRSAARTWTTLYITSASNGLSDAQLKEAPLSGSLFACEPGVRGVAEPSFAG